MALIEQIDSMKQSGFSDAQIAAALKEQGQSPVEINEAMSQLKIKNAVTGEMQPSITQSYPAPQAPVPNYSQQYAAEAQQYPQEQAYQAQYPQAQEQQYQQYPQEQYYAPAMDLGTIREIAKQEIDVSLKDIKKEIESLSKLKTDISFQMQSLDSRLKRIESVIQEIQSSIIRKMGEYGEAISGISDEIKATQDSFSKVINPLLDKKRGIKEAEQEEESYEKEEEKPSPKKSKSRGEKGASFEDYLGR